MNRLFPKLLVLAIVIVSVTTTRSLGATTCPSTKVYSVSDGRNTFYYEINDGGSNDQANTQDGELQEIQRTIVELPTYFDQHLQKCVPAVGKPCAVADDNCPKDSTCQIPSNSPPFLRIFGDCPNAPHCALFPDPHNPDFSDKNLKTLKITNNLMGTCSCKKGYIPNPLGESNPAQACIVAPKYGESCTISETQTCEGQGVVCLQNKCSCQNETVMEYNPTEGICAILVDSDFNCYGGNGASCIENSKCGWAGKTTCVCVYGFEAKDGHCVPAPKFGDVCSESRTCQGKRVKCQENKCVCEYDEMEFNPERQSCVYLTTSTAGCGEDDESCVVNSQCQRFGQRYSSSSRTTCECKTGFKSFDGGYNDNAIGRGRCYADHGGKCQKTSDCRPKKSFECIDSVCKCADPLNQIYVNEREACLAAIGSSCNSTSNGMYLQCVQNAGCVNGICQCNSLFSTTPNGRCERFQKFGESCVDRNVRCDFQKGLACVDSICQCLGSQTLNANGDCVASVGSRCGNFEHVGFAEEVLGKETYGDYYEIGCVVGSKCVTSAVKLEGKFVERCQLVF